jgi:hypothetical protein
MKMQDIVNKVSELYYAEAAEVEALWQEQNNLENALGDERMPHCEYVEKFQRCKDLSKLINNKTQYCAGIAAVKELLMNLSFNMWVE